MAKTHDIFIEELKQINPNVQVLGCYTRAVDRVEVRCLKCGKIWNPKAYSLLEGKSCSHCSAISGSKKNYGKTGTKTHQQFIKDLSDVDDSIKIVGAYQNTHSNIACQCSRCGHHWNAKPYSLLQGHGCPRCAKSGTSFMEQFLYLCLVEALGKDNIISRNKDFIGMELDIFVPSLKIAIEPGNWFLHSRSLERDRIKRERCAEKGVQLYTIYDKFPPSQECPFDSFCYVYEEDLNKADRKIICDLVYMLFEQIGIQHTFTDGDFARIELQAYENAKSNTHTDFVARMQLINPVIEILGTYQNANRRVKVRCSVCKYEWDGVPASLLAGDGCRKCGTVKAHEQFIKSQKAFVEEIAKVNPSVEILGKYSGRHSPIMARCLICGHTWNPRASSLLRGSSHKGSKAIHMRLEHKN